MARDEETVIDLIEAGQNILEFTRGMNKSTFLKDVKTRSAVIHQLLITGEAVKRLSAEFRVQHPQMPWSMIAGMRDRLIHHYDGVNLNEVWRTVEIDIPALLAFLEPLAPPRPPETPD